MSHQPLDPFQQVFDSGRQQAESASVRKNFRRIFYDRLFGEVPSKTKERWNVYLRTRPAEGTLLDRPAEKGLAETQVGTRPMTPA